MRARAARPGLQGRSVFLPPERNRHAAAPHQPPLLVRLEQIEPRVPERGLALERALVPAHAVRDVAHGGARKAHHAARLAARRRRRGERRVPLKDAPHVAEVALLVVEVGEVEEHLVARLCALEDAPAWQRTSAYPCLQTFPRLPRAVTFRGLGSRQGGRGRHGAAAAAHCLRQSCRSVVAPAKSPSAARACERRFQTSARSGNTAMALLKSLSALRSSEGFWLPASALHVPRATSAW